LAVVMSCTPYILNTKTSRMKRKQLSKRKRFEILKRDSFTCSYCGATPPKVVLEVDHIIPVSKGGDNNELNLVTSCFDCNRGKSNKELSEVVKPIDYDEERLLQYKQFVKFIKDKKKLEDKEVDMVCEVWKSFNDGYKPSAKYRTTIKQFITKMGVIKTIEAMEIACTRTGGDMKYFCGVCWGMIRKN
jgi:hypothetical protein